MLRSMYAGISGLKNFQTKLDVIGNNIANVNTTGFKKGRVTFQDMMSQTMRGAQGPTANRGGVNPSQVGLGSQIGSIDNIHTQGFRQTTNNPLDFALEGDGMFVVQQGDFTAFTRAGNFYLDQNGMIVNSDGLYLLGYPSVTMPAGYLIATENISVQFNEDNEVEALFTVDEFGREVVIDDFEVVGEEADVTIIELADGQQLRIDENGVMQVLRENASHVEHLASDSSLLASITLADGRMINVNYEGEDIESITVTTSDGDVVQLNDYTLDEDGNMTSITLSEDEVIQLDLNDQDHYVAVLETSGGLEHANIPLTYQEIVYTEAAPLQIPETAESFSVETDGTITIINEFGQPEVIGQIALANFSNPEGLEKAGSNLFLNSTNAGFNGLVVPGTDGAATIISGSLEMSNVDLAEEFTEMITAQRGFQANTRIITTSDEILQELVNLKR